METGEGAGVDFKVGGVLFAKGDVAGGTIGFSVTIIVTGEASAMTLSPAFKTALRRMGNSFFSFFFSCNKTVNVFNSEAATVPISQSRLFPFTFQAPETDVAERVVFCEPGVGVPRPGIPGVFTVRVAVGVGETADTVPTELGPGVGVSLGW